MSVAADPGHNRNRSGEEWGVQSVTTILGNRRYLRTGAAGVGATLPGEWAVSQEVLRLS